jgi:hypothetical protein
LLNGFFTFAVIEVTFDNAFELKVSGAAAALLAEAVLLLAVGAGTRLSRRVPAVKPLEVIPAVGLVVVDVEVGSAQL